MVSNNCKYDWAYQSSTADDKKDDGDRRVNGNSEKSSKRRPSPLQLLTSLMPILHWLPNYKWKEYFSGDLIAGLTVGIMHVPQGA
ncbi:unnamed protein product [Nippostrongylus brasiliensis]|uniref:Sulfate_transp domain-containing protein n=1 Tax=Nippostrongylus brasiliensis TaxID=27835 RepID=A0A0N4YXT6_NIPBR|nr:unnamed protein product [Nippostrongylus brasiliensis]